MTESPSQPPYAQHAARPPAALRWLAGTMRVHLLGMEGLTTPGAVLVAPRPYDVIARATLAARLDDAVLIAVDSRGPEVRRQIAEAIRLARAAGGKVYPVGIAVQAAFTVGRGAVPLPWARAVLIVEAPFQVPAQPEHIPDVWTDAVERLLKQSTGRASDILATWKHTGHAPEPG